MTTFADRFLHSSTKEKKKRMQLEELRNVKEVVLAWLTDTPWDGTSITLFKALEQDARENRESGL